MNVLFLDIDGVMNSANGNGPYLADMEISKLVLLKRILVDNEFDGVVISSDRRYSKPYMTQLENAFDQYEIFIIGEMRRPNDIDEDLEDNRGKQIFDYLESSAYSIDKIVILDDMDDGISDFFPEEFVHIDRFNGLDGKTAERIKAIMRK